MHILYIDRWCYKVLTADDATLYGVYRVSSSPFDYWYNYDEVPAQTKPNVCTRSTYPRADQLQLL